MRILPLLLSLALVGCASYRSTTEKGLAAFQARDYETAAGIYDKGAEEEGINQLLYLLDRATITHTAGNYQASNKDFLKADDLSDIKDYTSITRQAATIITNDRIVPYKGEEFETVMISTYLAINFALQGELESALVEARKVNRKLRKLKEEANRKYKFNAFAQYLSGLLYEMQGNWNNAYIDYKRTYAIKPDFTPIRHDLLMGASYTGNQKDLRRYENELGVTAADVAASRRLKRTHGSIVLLYENGLSPRKRASEQWHEIPVYKKTYNRNRSATLMVRSGLATEALDTSAETELMYDVEGAAISNLEQKYAAIVAKRVAGVAAREVIGHQVGKATKSEGLGAIVKIAMAAASQADTRGWYSLPQNLQIARIYVKPGRYSVKLQINSHEGTSGAVRDLGEVEIEKPGQVVLVNYRSFNDS